MDFVKKTLGDLTVGKGQYGIGASAVDYSEDLYTYLRITDINDDGTLNVNNLKSINDKNAERYLLQPNDIVFARTGNSTGRNYFYDGTDGILVYAGFLIKFSIDSSKVNPKYIKYYCMIPHLSNDQIVLLKNVLEGAMLKSGTGSDQSDEVLVDSFIAAKRLEGCSERTLVFYRNTIDKMLDSIEKNIKAITTEDLRGYLSEYQNSNMVSKVTIDNIRRNLSSFFSWLEDENYILKSPVRRIHRVKTTTSVKETYTDEDLERLRDSCTELRDLAMIDILASTGMRVGELVRLNRVDINFNERECVVFGKGDKERIVYFDARTKIHLQNYLDDRDDDNPALFVGLKHPFNRLKIGGVESRLKRMGKAIQVDKVHPHKFRRTMATTAIDKGMPIEQVQKLLGHEKIDTTLHYAMVKQSNVKNAHRRYIG